MKQAIRKITVASTGQSYEVGDAWGTEKILDKGIEYEDAIHFIYHIVNDGGLLITAIENCPCVVEYFH